MKLPSEVIPKFIISLEKDKERSNYLLSNVFPKIKNYIKCKAFDGEEDNINEFLEENKIFISDTFFDKCNIGQLGCFISHYQVWKYISDNDLDLAIVLEDDVKIYKNFNKIIDIIHENLPVKFDYVHLFIHPDKQKVEYLEGKEGEIIPAEDNFGTVAYIISLRGAKRLLKLTEMLKIQAPVDRQINFCINHKFLRAYMVKKPFLITQGEIMPHRKIYDNSFKSTIWYSEKLSTLNRIDKKFIKEPGFSDKDIAELEIQINKQKTKKLNENNQEVNIEENVKDSTEEKLEEKVDDKLEEKVEEKLEEKVEEKLEEKVEEKLEEKVEEKLEEKVEENRDDVDIVSDSGKVVLESGNINGVDTLDLDKVVDDKDDPDVIVNSVIGRLSEMNDSENATI